MIGELETPTRNPAGTRSVRRRDPRGRQRSPFELLTASAGSRTVSTRAQDRWTGPHDLSGRHAYDAGGSLRTLSSLPALATRPPRWPRICDLGRLRPPWRFPLEDRNEPNIAGDHQGAGDTVGPAGHDAHGDGVRS